MLGELFYADNGNIVAQIKTIVIGFGVSSFASGVVCVLCMVCCIQISNFASVVNDQTILWFTMINGICGSFTLSISIYASSEMTNIFTNPTQNAMHVLGYALLFSSLLSLIRISQAKNQLKISKRRGMQRNRMYEQKSSSFWFGKIHVTLLISLALVAAVMAASFLMTAQSIKLAEDINLDSFTIMKDKVSKLHHLNKMNLRFRQAEEEIVETEFREIRREENILNALTKKMQYYLYGLFMVAVSLYSLGNGIICSKIIRVHYQSEKVMSRSTFFPAPS